MAAKKNTEQMPDTIDDSAFMQNYIGGGGGAGTGVSEGYAPETPNYLLPPQRIEAGLFTQPKPLSVSGVVEPSGRIRPFYNLTTEPGQILGGVDDVTRMNIVNKLYSRGWYEGRNKEGGFGDNDRKAMENLLYYSNVRGVGWETMLNTISKAPISGGTGRAAQVTSTEDLVEVANRTALTTMGRKLSEAEAAQFAKAYQGAQRAEAGGSAQQAPSADVFFQNRIQQKYGAESEGYKYLTAISNVAKLIEGM